jgi:dihydroorotate dehydrogenase electron transfer subunit
MKKSLLHKPRIVRIEKIRNESNTVKSIVFKDRLCASVKPGQFSMIWIPKYDEIPMSLSLDPKSKLPMIVVKNIGEATNALHELSIGDSIGIRGPYGTSFDISNAKRILLVAGGTGIIPLLQIAMESNQKEYKCDIILGAKNVEEILFYDDLKSADCTLCLVTEDGSLGEQGLVVDMIKKSLTGKHDVLMCCGPEPMIKSIIDIVRKTNIGLQASLERIMKCGIGICGSCEISGFRVCKDGPVFGLTELNAMHGVLGNLKRSHSGKLIDFKIN